jgi:hypothetical protein
MRAQTCYNCLYACFDPEVWLRWMWSGLPPVPMCANYPTSPGQLREVPGTPCRNHRFKPATPSGDIRRIPVGGGLYAYVDAADYEELSRYKWSCNNSGYAARREKGKVILMHRQIMRPPKGKIVDHIDRNRLNDCRSNLRICSEVENKQNQAKRLGCTSRFKGVYYYKKSGKWCARITFWGKASWLGCFDDEVKAARAYDRKAVELFAGFAQLNFPEEWPAERRQEVHAQWQKDSGKRVGKKGKAKATRGKRHAQAPEHKPCKRRTCKARGVAGRSRRKAVDS